MGFNALDDTTIIPILKARSSVVERHYYMVKVDGSIPRRAYQDHPKRR